jgi:protocatechuate 3,4-dioxygenase alpha subunit
MSGTDGTATASQTAGPFFHLGLKRERSGVAAPGDRVRLDVWVTDGDGCPVDDALVELWTSTEFARLATGKDGTFEVDLQRAPYINVCLFARGLLRHLHTRVYFARDPGLTSDPVFARVPEDRRSTLLACPDPQVPGRWLFHVRLQGPQETVFFDI